MILENDLNTCCFENYFDFHTLKRPTKNSFGYIKQQDSWYKVKNLMFLDGICSRWFSRFPQILKTQNYNMLTLYSRKSCHLRSQLWSNLWIIQRYASETEEKFLFFKKKLSILGLVLWKRIFFLSHRCQIGSRSLV